MTKNLPLSVKILCNSRSGVALATHHRLSGLSTYGHNGHRKGDAHSTYALEGHSTLYLFTTTTTTAGAATNPHLRFGVLNKMIMPEVVPDQTVDTTLGNSTCATFTENTKYSSRNSTHNCHFQLCWHDLLIRGSIPKPAPWFFLRLWHFINHLLTYLPHWDTAPGAPFWSHTTTLTTSSPPLSGFWICQCPRWLLSNTWIKSSLALGRARTTTQSTNWIERLVGQLIS